MRHPGVAGKPWRNRTRSTALLTCLLVLGGSLSASESVEPKEPRLFKRVAMIGASASGGFTLKEPFGGELTQRFNLGNYLETGITVTNRAPLQNHGNSLFFLRPLDMANYQLKETLPTDPTLVIAADFLFWFCYGQGANGAERLARLETGLSLLDPVTAPLVIGDLPDASEAIGAVLRAEQVPDPQTLSAANQRIRRWAGARSNTIVIPLSSFMENAMADKAITVRDTTRPAGETRALLQPDKLHPSESGTALLALVIFDALDKAGLNFETNAVIWDFEHLRDKTLARLEAKSVE